MKHTVTDRWLREELRTIREAKGLTKVQAAEAAVMHVRTVERIEEGPEGISADSLGKLLHAYGVERHVRNRLRDMRDLARATGWWDDWHDVLGTTYAEHCELEEIADRIDLYAPTIFQGLVQSPQYAQFVQSLWLPRDSDRTRRFVELRAERQRRYWPRRRPVRLLIDEMIFTRSHGPLREQTDYVLDLQTRGCLEARLLPLSEPSTLPDVFVLFTVGHRKVACLGAFTEYHVEEPGVVLTDAPKIFDRAWHQAEPFTELDRIRIPWN